MKTFTFVFGCGGNITNKRVIFNFIDSADSFSNNCEIRYETFSLSAPEAEGFSLYALRGYWKTANKFEVEFNWLSKINKYPVDFKMGDRENEVSIREGTHKINEVLPVSIKD
ncbi:hypothetical protein [Chitinophaga sp. Ak27]|uniref:hypothetical protein n=1 Tax=Chitinophaga sp. Ak27 TaxID=2726116 RepID=UPI00145F675C|nr:hypothetical protein [Chitinophaga sp. Ak27]